MGIKFYCPNGHKLNVKSFLSGKKAICPKCGVKVVVPAESTVPQTPVAAGAAATTEPDAVEAAFPDFENDVAAAVEEISAPMNPAEFAREEPAAPVGHAHQPVAAAVPLVATAVIPGAMPAVADPIAEAPTAVWYVRPPSGGQFGPAAGEIMRQWLAEGRVTSSSLVWRAGWPDWRSAATTFPQFAPASAIPAAVGMAHGAMPVGAVPMGGVPTGGLPMGGVPGAGMPMGAVPVGAAMNAAMAPVGEDFGAIIDPSAPIAEDTSARRLKRRSSNDTTMIVSGILAVLAIALVVVLVLVLTQEPIQIEAKPPKAMEKSGKHAVPAKEKAKGKAKAKTKAKAEKPPADDDDELNL